MALIYPQNGDLKKLLKSSRKKVPYSARLSAGGGCKSYKGNAQMPFTLFFMGLPLPRILENLYICICRLNGLLAQNIIFRIFFP